MCDSRGVGRVEIKGKTVKVDKCLVDIITELNVDGLETVGCCCGHGKYDTTIIIRHESGKVYELYSEVIIPRVKRFYKLDSEKYYYVPEIK